MAIPTEYGLSRFQLLKHFWGDISVAVTEAIEDKKLQKQVLGKIKQNLCDRLFPMDIED